MAKEVKAAAAEAVNNLAAHEKQQVGLEEQSKHAKSKAKKFEKDDNNAKAAAIRTIQDSSEKMKKKKAEVEEYELSLDKEEKILEGIRDSLKDKTQVFHHQIEVKQKELQPWTAKINTKQAEVDAASSERDALAKKAEAVKDASKEVQEALEKLRADQEAKASALAELKMTKPAYNGTSRTERRSYRWDRDAQARVQDLRRKASYLHQRADEAKASQATSTSQNKVLDSLTWLRSAGCINGFHGRFGSLGTIPDKYGQPPVNVGRASFMVLEKLSSTGSLKKIATPDNVRRLFDFIKRKEPRFAPAFFKGVSNTLVAEDLDWANCIAFGSGNHVAKGGMSSKPASEAISPQTLKVYEEESEEAAKRHSIICSESKRRLRIWGDPVPRLISQWRRSISTFRGVQGGSQRPRSNIMTNKLEMKNRVKVEQWSALLELRLPTLPISSVVFIASSNFPGSASIVGSSGSTLFHFTAANGRTNVVGTLLLHAARTDRANSHRIIPEMPVHEKEWTAEVLTEWLANKNRDLREHEGEAGVGSGLVLGEIPILASEQVLLDEANGTKESDGNTSWKKDEKLKPNPNPRVLANETYATESVYTSTMTTRLEAVKAATKPPLRMLIMTSIIRVGQSKFVMDVESAKAADDAIDYDEDVRKATGCTEIREDFISNLSYILQLTGFSDPVYAEAYVKMHGFNIMLDVLLVNQTPNMPQNLCLDFATLSDLKLVERSGFRSMWTEFEWENQVNVTTPVSEPRDYMKYIMKSINMSCLTPEGAMSGDCEFLSANMYPRSLFGEDVLANVSIEKTEDW
ncbi:hypothetical protein PILCRDRAFT_15413 [Piloderma croceum F 1598]|uniref:Coatomer beta subunit appendage platform domain-containing protein n=1 Tax=Piloderma croceum (strain F 1598) TaxID=765440 RepID=A0A0C3AHE4_PILCF|nr:hypothetical protein PILCRDRAFT_15413 [Piloderma croceum F 1598]